jgi:hypothetical protein
MAAQTAELIKEHTSHASEIESQKKELAFLKAKFLENEKVSVRQEEEIAELRKELMVLQRRKIEWRLRTSELIPSN